MEILGYELSPDFAIYDGNFSDDASAENADSSGADSDVGGKLDHDSLGAADVPGKNQDEEPAARFDVVIAKDKKASEFITEDETKRVAASRPTRMIRFQYRETAADHAIEAANLLPRSSQAFAAVLCKASAWVDGDRSDAIYARYLRQGAYFSWGRDFGHRCPQPDSDEAASRHLARRAQSVAVRARVHPALALAIGSLGSALVLAIGLALSMMASRQ